MRHPLDLPAVFALRRLVIGERVSLVHTHSSVDAWLGGFAARRAGVPVVRSRHVTIAVPRRRALVYRLADRVVTSGAAVAGVLARAGVPPAKLVPIAPGVDTRRFHPGVTGAGVRAELGLGQAPLVGLVANIRGSKGHDYFLVAAGEVLRTEPAARFVIVGDGVGFDDVRRRVADLGLERAVTMTGFRRDIPEVLAALDVLTLPSIRSEATSQVLLQALAVGTPVIASTVGGSGEIVRDGETGCLVPPADAPALARAIVGLLRDRERARAMARRGQALVGERYSLDASMGQLTAVYAALLDTRPAPSERGTRGSGG